MAELICIGGAYHGRKATEPSNGAGRIRVEGDQGEGVYTFRFHLYNGVALYGEEGASLEQFNRALAIAT